MPRRVAVEDDWEDDDSEEEEEEYVPDNEDDEYSEPEDDGDALIECPWCKKEIFEESEQCPHCHQYISVEDKPRSRMPLWIAIGTLLCLFAVFRCIF